MARVLVLARVDLVLFSGVLPLPGDETGLAFLIRRFLPICSCRAGFRDLSNRTQAPLRQCTAIRQLRQSPVRRRPARRCDRAGAVWGKRGEGRGSDAQRRWTDGHGRCRLLSTSQCVRANGRRVAEVVAASSCLRYESAVPIPRWSDTRSVVTVFV